MKSVLEIFSELSNTNSRNDKVKILKENQDNLVFLDLLKFALDPTYNYWIEETPSYTYNSTDLTFSDQQIKIELENLCNTLNKRLVTGNSAIEFYQNVLSRLPNNISDILTRVIKRDLKISLGVKTINKAIPKLIYDHPYMRSSSYTEKNIKNIKLPAYCQLKADGMYTDVVVDYESNVTFFSRSGQILNITDQELISYYAQNFVGYVVQGEILVTDEEGRLLKREVSNGLLNKSDIQSIQHRIIIQHWDLIQLDDFKKHESITRYDNRFELLSNRLKKEPFERVLLIESALLDNMDSIKQTFSRYISQGLEGAILKNTNTRWKYNTSKDQVKLKIDFDVDLVIVDCLEEKNGGKLGSFICQSSDGLLSVGVGSGYSKEQRVSIWNNIESYKNKIITVRANDIMYNMTGKHSLFLPRSITGDIRLDKTVADNFTKIEHELESAKNGENLCL